MTYFLCKMILPRSDFIQTMTDSERNIMKAHGDYLQSLAEIGSIVCHGPVDDPKGGWGLSIFSAKDQTEVERLTAADPIILDDVGATYEPTMSLQRSPHPATASSDSPLPASRITFATGTGLLWQWLSINSVHRQITRADSSE